MLVSGSHPLLSPNILGNFLPRHGVGFGGQPADSGVVFSDSTFYDQTLQYQEDLVNRGTSLRIDASRSSSIYATGANLQIPACVALVAIRF